MTIIATIPDTILHNKLIFKRFATINELLTQLTEMILVQNSSNAYSNHN
jgi:hypothetical protein